MAGATSIRHPSKQKKLALHTYCELIVIVARPKQNNPALFVMGELAKATGFSPRNVQLIRDKRKGPFESEEVIQIASNNGTYDENTAAHLAMIAGVHSAGLPLLLACDLVNAFLEDAPNHVAGRFCNLDGTEVGRSIRPGGDWFAAFEALQDSDEMTLPNDSDAMIYVADRTYVLSGKKKSRIRMAVPAGVDGSLPSPICRVDGLQKGKEFRVVPAYLECDLDDQASEIALFQSYHTAFENAVGLITVNLSLSIRLGFAAVAEMRRAKGGPFFAIPP
jgi:hypothetical protein